MTKKIQQIGSEKGELSSYDYKSWVIYTFLTAISILIPFGISYVGNLQLPAEVIASISFLLNSGLILIKKIAQDRSYIIKKM